MVDMTGILSESPLKSFMTGGMDYNKYQSDMAAQQARNQYAQGNQGALRQLQAYDPNAFNVMQEGRIRQQEAQLAEMQTEGRLLTSAYNAISASQDLEGKRRAYDAYKNIALQNNIQLPEDPDLMDFTPNTEKKLGDLAQQYNSMVSVQSLPFEGQSWQAQMGEVMRQQFMAQGMTPSEAKMKATQAIVNMQGAYVTDFGVENKFPSFGNEQQPPANSSDQSLPSEPPLAAPAVTSEPLPTGGQEVIIPVPAFNATGEQPIDAGEYGMLDIPSVEEVQTKSPIAAQVGKKKPQALPEEIEFNALQEEQKRLESQLKSLASDRNVPESIYKRTLAVAESNRRDMEDAKAKVDSITQRTNQVREKLEKSNISKLLTFSSEFAEAIDELSVDDKGLPRSDIPGFGSGSIMPASVYGNKRDKALIQKARLAQQEMGRYLIQAITGAAMGDQEAKDIGSLVGINIKSTTLADGTKDYTYDIANYVTESSLKASIDQTLQRTENAFNELVSDPKVRPKLENDAASGTGISKEAFPVLDNLALKMPKNPKLLRENRLYKIQDPESNKTVPARYRIDETTGQGQFYMPWEEGF